MFIDNISLFYIAYQPTQMPLFMLYDTNNIDAKGEQKR